MRICVICFIVWSFNIISAQERIEIDCVVDMNTNKVVETYQISSEHQVRFTLDQTQTLQAFSGHYWIGEKRCKLKKKLLDYHTDSRNPNNSTTTYSYVFPKGKVPDKVVYNYIALRNDVMYLAAFDFEPMKSYALTIHVDTSYQVAYVADAGINSKEEVILTNLTYQFHLAAKSSDAKLQLMVHPKDQLPTAYFAHWYLSMITAEHQLSAASKLEIDRIVKTGSNKTEKAILYFEYIQNETNYYGHESSHNIIRPQNVNEVLRSKFGDCKDLSLLLYAGFEYLGLDSYFGILNLSKNISHPYFLSSFDHAICVVKLGNEYRCLDATDKENSFEKTSPVLLDKKILLLSRDVSDGTIISPKL